MKQQVSAIFRKLSIFGKFSLGVIFLIIIMTVTLNLLIVNHQKGVLRAELENKQLFIAKNLANDAVVPLIVMDPLKLDELVQTSAQLSGLSYALVADRDKRIVAHTARTFLGRAISPALQNQATRVLSERETHIDDGQQDGIKKIIVPVQIGYEVLGIVIAGFSRDSTDGIVTRNMQDLERYIFLISGFVIVVGIGSATVLARQLTIPMKKLKEKMEEVQAGNLDITVPNDHLLNCWEVLRCARQDCPAYGKTRCWTIPGTKCFGCEQGGIAEKICDCKKCIIYRESCGDEVGELVEVFNQMVGDLKNNLQELEEANREKFRLDRLSALGQIAAGVAHEINNPLGGISLCFNNLIETKMDEDTRRQHIEVIRSGFDRIQRIVKQLLDYSKHSELRMSRTSIHAILSNVLRLSEYTVAKKGISIKEQFAADMPEVTADASKLEQVFLNLVINAVQAMDGGGILTVRTACEGNTCRVSLSDTGKGIPREVLPRIFDPFFTTKDSGEGTGLGLSVSKAIIEQHKGEITAETSEAGTTFTVHLRLL
ncbi:MAG: ATP-binding protein [Nitrospirota bacterium]|nr:ATP-binding protein [Nitrospirota bacterium]